MKFPLKINQRYIPITATVGVFVALYAIATILYPGFLSPQVFVNFFNDNSFLGIAAVGMTFVIISGGIDLSVGSMLAFSGIMMASMIENGGVHPLAAMLVVVACGALLGTLMGLIIQYLKAPPFIVTLGGMFLARGIGQLISPKIAITNEWMINLSTTGLPLPGDLSLPAVSVIFLVVFVAGIYAAHWTRFGRTVYAIGGSQQSAILMGLPVARTKVLVYTLSGVCSSIAGIVYTLYTSAGYGLSGVGFEMDVIASVVIGGTLITGGVGLMVGTLFGVLIQGVIQTFISFQGSLTSWWTRIFIGGLLLVFILFQMFFSRTPTRRESDDPIPGPASRPSLID